MIDSKFLILGGLLTLVGDISYLRATLKGETKPNRVSWFLWALAPMIAGVAELGEHVGGLAFTTLMFGVGPLLVFLASFLNRKAFWQISRLDIVCGILSLAALVLWRATGVGTVAIALGIAADFLASVPTLVKSFYDPESEHYAAYLGSALSATIALLVLDRWSFAAYGFQAYILVICVVLFALIQFKIGPRFFLGVAEVEKQDIA